MVVVDKDSSLLVVPVGNPVEVDSVVVAGMLEVGNHLVQGREQVPLAATADNEAAVAGMDIAAAVVGTGM